MSFSSSAGWSVGELYGHRVFDISSNSISSPVQQRFVWKDGVNTSKCSVCVNKRQPNCSCGFYAYYDYKDQGFHGDTRGVIRGYGMVDKGSLGFKAEKAEIVALHISAKYIPYGADLNAEIKGEPEDEPKAGLRERWDTMSRRQIRNMAIAFGFLVVAGTVGLSVSLTISTLLSIVFGAALAAGVSGYVYSITRLGRVNPRSPAWAHNNLVGFNWKTFRARYPSIKIYTDLDQMFADYEDIMKEQRKSVVSGISERW